MKILPIALTGGPGGGKTQAMQTLRHEYIRKGIHVITIPETATDLILSGLDGRRSVPNRIFQAAQLDLQLFKEDLSARIARHVQAPTVVIVCDRGALDGLAFCDPEEFEKILRKKHLSRTDLLARYDAVIHMSTAARNRLSDYSLSSNPARTETACQALEEDDRLLDIYRSHPARFVIEAFDDPTAKTRALIACLDRILKDAITE